MSDVVKGLERVQALAASHKIAAVNMSLGGGKFLSHCDSTQPSAKAAIDNLRSLGIATIIASGNEGFTDSISSPGCISSAVSVGSTGDGSQGTFRDVVSDFSNSASFLSLLAPGAAINSSVPGGGFDNFGGTSMATPHVAGAWAVLKSKAPSAPVDEILNALASTGASIFDGRNGIAKPRIRIDAALNALGSGDVQAGYSPGTVVTLTATPNPGFAFVKWQRNGADFSTNASVTVSMNAANTMTAVFREASSNAPFISSVVYDGKKKLTISGSRFGIGPRVVINNVDRTTRISKASDTSILAKGKASKLGLRSGDNTIQIIGSDGQISNSVVLRL
jgi:subtilisin family serine protease